MHISPEDQLDADIDYFTTDEAGHILHVASGGGRLPESVAASQEALLALHQHFLLRPETEVVKGSRGGAGGFSGQGLLVRW